MFLGIRKKYWGFLAATLALAGLMAFMHLSPVFALRRTTISGPLSDRIATGEAAAPGDGVNLFRFDKTELAGQLLAQANVEKVTLTLDMPHDLHAKINGFQPVALVMADRLSGLDDHARLIPYDPFWADKDLPVMTGLTCPRLFAAPDDYRIAEVIDGLVLVREEIPALYRQIAEVDFSDDACLTIFLTTGDERYIATSRDFAAQLLKLDMMRSYLGPGDGGWYDLQYGGVVIKRR